MDDLTITKLCAAAMGFKVLDNKRLRLMPEETRLVHVGRTKFDLPNVYDPLHDDAQLLSLAKKFPYEFEKSVIEWCNHLRRGESFNLNYEFCKRVAEKK